MKSFSGMSIAGAAALAAIIGCAAFAASPSGKEPALRGGAVGTDPGYILESGPLHLKPKGNDQLASFSGGCFWGVEDVFRQVPGVVATAVGYTGGHTTNPTYEDVCTHTTGHAETVLVEFDPAKTSYKKLLAVFWENHNPTTVDRQGPDVGSNYRSAIWTYSKDQQAEAEASVAAQQKKLTHQIVTQIKPAETFYLAEDYHQQYDERHGTHFCPIDHGN